MPNQYKEILLQDICARLPYGVKIRRIIYTTHTDTIESVETLNAYWLTEFLQEGNIKPYLRPMSSMTDEEKSYFHNFKYWILKGDVENCTIHMVDWLNAHHFDYRGLIEKGLALEATEGIYKIKN
jgi:hypothetical protein